MHQNFAYPQPDKVNFPAIHLLYFNGAIHITSTR